MRTRFHASTSARPIAIASAPRARDDARALEPARRAEQRARRARASRRTSRAGRRRRRACRRSARPTRGTRRRSRRARGSAASVGALACARTARRARDRGDRRDRSSLSVAGDASSSAAGYARIVPSLRVDDRARLIERGPRDEARQRADVEVDGEHRAQLAVAVVDRLGARDAGLVALEERVRLGPRARALARRRAGRSRACADRSRAARSRRSVQRAVLDGEPARLARRRPCSPGPRDASSGVELRAAKRAVGKADAEKRDARARRPSGRAGARARRRSDASRSASTRTSFISGSA